MGDVFDAGLVLTGLWIAFISAQSLRRGQRSRSWPSVPGTIRAVAVVRKLNSHGHPVRRERLEYRYHVDEKKYLGTRVRFGIPAVISWLPEAVPESRKGDAVEVVYDPAHPAVSTLHRGFAPFAAFALSGSILVMVLGLRWLVMS